MAAPPPAQPSTGSDLQSPTLVPVRYVEANGNLYVTAPFGLARVTSATGTWTPAVSDIPQLTADYYAAGTFLLTNYQVAYRATFRYTDANGNVHRSAPSAKLVFTNPGTTYATCGVTLSVGMSAMVISGTVLELWRTVSVPVPSDGTDGTGDECFKVAEVTIATTVGANGYMIDSGASSSFATINDNTPNASFLVEPLYTNPTTGQINGLGIGNANTPPPVAADVFEFKSYTYFANTEEVQRLTLQIIGTGTGGIVTGDTFSVDGVSFIFKDTVTGLQDSAGRFQIQLWRIGATADKGSIVENFRATAISAAQAICIGTGYLYWGNTGARFRTVLDQMLRATPMLVDGLPGYIEIERLVPTGQQFSAVPGTGAGRGWNGLLAINATSDSNRQLANLMQSQVNDPESVPVAYTNVVGRPEFPILRGIPLRDNAYMFKGGDDGLWKFSDDGSGTLTIGPLDQTVHLVAPETAVSLDNAIFCLADKGVLRITDGGSPEAVSNDKVQNDLLDLMRYVGPATLSSVAFAVGYESERMYVLCLPESPNATSCTVQYVYNLQTDAWTRWTLPFLLCGGIEPSTDLLMVGRAADLGVAREKLWVERKNLDEYDFQDPSLTLTCPAAP